MTSSPVNFDVLDAREAATYLKINEQTVRRLARERGIPCFKVGGSWRFKKSSLDRWAAFQERGTPAAEVLLVDPEEASRRALRRSLESEGFHVEAVGETREALHSFQRRVPDLILLDLPMLASDGGEILRTVRQRHPQIPVVVLAAAPDPGLLEKALEFSPFTLVSKPSTPEKLARILQNCLSAS